MIRIVLNGAIVVSAGLMLHQAQARDAFDGVKCDGDIVAALSGQHLGGELDDVLEKKHASIGLKAEGGEIITDDLNYAAWTICGGSYHMLARRNVIRSVVRADHSKSAPSFLGQCEVNGKPIPGVVFAILKPSSTGDIHASANDHTLLPAVRAWRIDENGGRFVETGADGMMCPRDGVATADGGP